MRLATNYEHIGTLFVENSFHFVVVVKNISVDNNIFVVNNIVQSSSRQTSLTSFIHPVASAQKLSKAFARNMKNANSKKCLKLLPEALRLQIALKI